MQWGREFLQDSKGILFRPHHQDRTMLRMFSIQSNPKDGDHSPNGVPSKWIIYFSVVRHGSGYPAWADWTGIFTSTLVCLKCLPIWWWYFCLLLTSKVPLGAHEQTWGQAPLVLLLATHKQHQNHCNCYSCICQPSTSHLQASCLLTTSKIPKPLLSLVWNLSIHDLWMMIKKSEVPPRYNGLSKTTFIWKTISYGY